MSKKAFGLIAAVCLVAAALAGVVGAQVTQTTQRTFLNTGLFSVSVNEIAYFHVSLDDQPGAPGAKMLLQLIDETGTVVVWTEQNVRAGHSLTLRTPGPGFFRAHAVVTDTVSQPNPRRKPLHAAEVINSVTGVVRPIPSFDPHQIPSRP
jgi:hypothetical protein